MNENKHPEGFWTGLVVGGLIGAFAALMLGEKEGKLLRKKLKSRSQKLLSLIEGAVEEKKAEVQKKITEEVGVKKEEIDEQVEKLQSRGRAVARRFFRKAGKKLS